MNIFLIGGTTVVWEHKSFSDQRAVLQKAMTPFRRRLIEQGPNLLVSADSADLPTVRGAVQALLVSKADTARVQYHHPDSRSVLLEFRDR